MNRIHSFFLIIVGFLVISCSSSNSSNEAQSEEVSETQPESSEDVSELSYSDVIQRVFNDEGEGVEWHGEALPNDLIEFLDLSGSGVCGESDCGIEFTLKNNSDRTIVAIARGDYDIKGDQGYIARKYTIEAGASLSMGCSHLCYEGEAYPFRRSIVGSEYLEE